MTLTPFLIKALLCIHENPRATATELAESLWPDHPSHKATKRCGRTGITYGCRLNYVAAGYRSKLKKAGLVQGIRFHTLTTKGLELLASQGIVLQCKEPL